MVEKLPVLTEENIGKDRKFWLETMFRIASPVLSHLANGTLNEALPRELNEKRSDYRCLEAFGRTVCGIAPWLELEGLTGAEAEWQNVYRALVRVCIDRAMDPASSDYMNFSKGPQPLVDTAFLAHGILRAPNQLWHRLPDRVKSNLVSALKSSRVIPPPQNNWLLFASMVEAALFLMGEEIDTARFYEGVDRFEAEWYCGDGIYGDGPQFHFDYYNSFVIQPMLLDTVKIGKDFDPRLEALCPTILKRAMRYAAILERMIAPDGSYIVIGRSVCYRFGAFQLLSQAALASFLPPPIPAGQARCALTAVMKRCADAPDMFRGDGWLNPGIFGNQPELAEMYINTGSLYLCCAVFLALGLSPESDFRQAPAKDWTQKQIWSGGNAFIDQALK